uniref:Alternative protein BRE n=1 Tax=Homo sapiens TaxID=9606 RepID=L8E9D4_HUMAN|nr:alternative protein BRE [Homo sapiens]
MEMKWPKEQKERATEMGRNPALPDIQASSPNCIGLISKPLSLSSRRQHLPMESSRKHQS